MLIFGVFFRGNYGLLKVVILDRQIPCKCYGYPEQRTASEIPPEQFVLGRFISFWDGVSVQRLSWFHLFFIPFLMLPSRELAYPPDKAYLKMIFLFQGIFEDDFPFSQVGYVNFLEGILKAGKIHPPHFPSQFLPGAGFDPLQRRGGKPRRPMGKSMLKKTYTPSTCMYRWQSLR